MGTGSPEYASQWRDIFEGISSPEIAQARYPEVQARRFPNGEWIYGVCRDSHEHQDGGTVVVKDSGGNIHAFFGHVCGSEFLASDLMHRDPKSLDEFYRLGPWELFKEHPFRQRSAGDRHGETDGSNPTPPP